MILALEEGRHFFIHVKLLLLLSHSLRDLGRLEFQDLAIDGEEVFRFETHAVCHFLEIVIDISH